MFLLPVGYGAFRLLRGRSGYPRTCCSHCGYDLRYNMSGRCPECGRPSALTVSREVGSARLEPRGSLRRIALAALCFLCAFFGVGELLRAPWGLAEPQTDFPFELLSIYALRIYIALVASLLARWSYRCVWPRVPVAVQLAVLVHSGYVVLSSLFVMLAGPGEMGRLPEDRLHIFATLDCPAGVLATTIPRLLAEERIVKQSHTLAAQIWLLLVLGGLQWTYLAWVGLRITRWIRASSSGQLG